MSNPPSNAPDERAKQREVVRKSIAENAAFDTTYVVMNALATVVACYGLLENSVAVVIGAMVIATLLGPIMGISLALVDGETALLRKALLAEVGGVAVVLSLAVLIGGLHHDLPLTHEILARTSPCLLDLFIALAGGAAGAYATTAPRVSVGLVGVAIATALVPPLAACGICLARGQLGLGFGAFMLFATNLVAIQFASSVVLWWRGYARILSRAESGRGVALRNATSFGALGVLGVALALHATQTLTTHLYEGAVRAKLKEELQAFPDVDLTEVRFQQNPGKMVVLAVVRSPAPFGPDKVAALEAKLPPLSGVTLELRVRSVIAHQATRNDYLQQGSESSDVLEPVEPRP